MPAREAELERLRRGGLAPTMPSWPWEFDIALGPDPEATWKRILEAVSVITSADPEEWPEDSIWSDRLPIWLTSYFMTLEQVDAAMASVPREKWDELGWEFGSWLDAMRERDWRWWGGERRDQSARIVLQVTGIPPRIDAFKQILLAAGGVIVAERYEL
jgi:hypothetical protein